MNYNYSTENVGDNHVYYNITISNNTNTNGIKTLSPLPTISLFTETRNTPLLKSGSNYELSIVRFTVPATSVPLSVIQIQPYPNTDINKTIYSITLQYGASIVQEFLEWVPNNNSPLPSALSSSSPFQQDNTPYYYMYELQEFVNMLNIAFYNAFHSLASTPVGAIPPFVIYDPNSGLFSFVVDKTYITTDNLGTTTGIKVYMNSYLENYYYNLDTYFEGYNSANGEDYQLLFENKGNNIQDQTGVPIVSNPLYYPLGNPALPINPSTIYYIPLVLVINKQPYSTVWKFCDEMQSIVFTSNIVPLAHEFTSPQIILASPYIKQQASSSNSFLPIITDFSVASAVENLGTNRQQYVFTAPSQGYRYIDIKSNLQINQFDMNVYYLDRNNQVSPLYLNYNETITVKLQFVRKDRIVN